MQGRFAGVQVALALFTLSLLTFVLIEIGARVAVGLVEAMRFRLATAEDPRPALAAYASAAYDAEALFREERAADEQMYRPYVVWSRKPFAGDLIRIDERGERATPAGTADDPDLVVWMLGGSTTWGMGAPDDETIASHLARRLEARGGIGVRVRNLGEIGYVSTQEIVRLLRELQRGDRPDLVVFFDGVNDAAAAALWPGVPGVHMNFDEIRERFERRAGPPPAWRELVRQSGVYRLAREIARFLGHRGRPAPVPWDASQDPGEIADRATEAVEVWIENTGIVEAFARRHGFETLFLLQPSLMVGEKPLHPSEEAILEKERGNAAKVQSMDVYREMRDEMRRRSRAGEAMPVADLSDVFADVEAPLYFDYVHLSGEGNRILGDAIASRVVTRLCRDGARAGPRSLGQLCDAARR